MIDPKLSLGENRVRTQFNPSNNSDVEAIKQKTAELINLIGNLPKPEDEKTRNEMGRLVALAQTHYEAAAMWAVKAATA